MAAEDLQGRHKRRKNKEERMKSVLEGRHPFVSVGLGIYHCLHCAICWVCMPSYFVTYTEGLKVSCLHCFVVTWIASCNSLFACDTAHAKDQIRYPVPNFHAGEGTAVSVDAPTVMHSGCDHAPVSSIGQI